MAGPYIGKRGGKWANPQHTIPWKEGKGGQVRRHPHHASVVHGDDIRALADHFAAALGDNPPAGKKATLTLHFEATGTHIIEVTASANPKRAQASRTSTGRDGYVNVEVRAGAAINGHKLRNMLAHEVAHAADPELNDSKVSTIDLHAKEHNTHPLERKPLRAEGMIDLESAVESGRQAMKEGFPWAKRPHTAAQAATHMLDSMLSKRAITNAGLLPEMHAYAVKLLTMEKSMNIGDMMGPAIDASRYKGVLNYRGILLGIEHVAGQPQFFSGKKTRGSYGEIPGTLNGDGDPVDFLLGDHWDQNVAYVIQQRIPNEQTDPDMGEARGNGGPKQYDEDKVVFAAKDREDAIALFQDYYAGANREVGGVIELTITELRDRLWCPGRQGLPIFKAAGEATIEWLDMASADSHVEAQRLAILHRLEKSHRLDSYREGDGEVPEWVFDSIVAQWDGPGALVKSIGARPPGAGWHPIPGGRRGGWRKKRSGGKGYDYKYNDQHETDHHADWEPVPGQAGVAAMEPGQFMFIEGKRGVYRWTPDHEADPGEGYTWATSLETGAHDRVQTARIRPARGFDPVKRKKEEDERRRKRRKQKLRPTRKPRPTRTGPAPRPPVGDIPPNRPAPIRNQDLPTSDTPSENAEMVPAFEDSKANPGTITHKIENGDYMIVAYRDGAGKDKVGMFVPPADHQQLVTEMNGLMHAAATEVAASFGIKPQDGGGPTAAYEELFSNAQLGMVLATRSYKGQVGWGAHAYRYAKTYAAIAAREEMGGGVPVPPKMRRLAEGYMAAVNRASAALGVETPTDEQVARHWSVTKKVLYTKDLGRYERPHRDKPGEFVVVDQSNEQVPMDSWQIKTPTGEGAGKEYPGKVALVAELREFTSGQRMSDGEVLEGLQVAAVLPQHAAHTMPTGTALHLRSEVDAVLAEMEPQHVQALALRWGLDGQQPMEMHELSVALGLVPEDAKVAKKRYESQKIVKRATEAFKRKADARDAEARKYADRWSAVDRQEGPRIDTIDGYSHSDLAKEFGGDLMRVRIFQSALGEGNAEATMQALKRETAGELSDKESRQLRIDHFQRRDRQRLKAFHQQTQMYTVDPDKVKDIATGTDPNSVALYADEVMHGYMQVVAKHGSGIVASPAGGGRERWSDDRLARFLGVHPSTLATGQGDNQEKPKSEA